MLSSRNPGQQMLMLTTGQAGHLYREISTVDIPMTRSNSLANAICIINHPIRAFTRVEIGGSVGRRFEFS